MLSTYLWLVTTVLDGAEIEHFLHHRRAVLDTRDSAVNKIKSLPLRKDFTLH
jgi:hypothetical protein